MSMLAKLEIIVKNECIQSFGYDESGILIYQLTEDESVNGLEVIYKAKISSLNYKSKFAYIEYAPNLQGVINLSNIKMQMGSDLLCQMTWQGNEQKLAKFSEDVKLMGKYIILLVDEAKHYFSKQLKNKEPLAKISDRYANVGIIFRSSINDIENIDIVDDEIRYLVKELDVIKQWKTKKNGALTKPIYKFMQLLREAKLSPAIEIITNNQEIFDYILPYMDLWQFDAVSIDESIKLDTGQNQIRQYKEFSLETHKLSGINLIDINSKNSALSFFQVNYLAIDEIIRQIYLQDMTGIILVDFIKNMTLEEERKLLNKISQLLETDWRKNQLLGITKAGICEIIRNK